MLGILKSFHKSNNVYLKRIFFIAIIASIHLFITFLPKNDSLIIESNCEVNTRIFQTYYDLSEYESVLYLPYDVYVVPEIKNFNCLSKIKQLSFEDNNLIVYYGTNPKVKILILASIFLFNLIYFKKINNTILFNFDFLLLNFLFFDLVYFFYLINIKEINDLFIIILFSYIFILEKCNLGKYQNLENFKSYRFFFGIFIIFYLVITQSYTLNYETIDWDVNVFLSASQEVNRGNLPLENQFTTKPPLLSYIVYFIVLLSKNNLFIYKVLNDLILLFLLFITYLITSKITKSQIKQILVLVIFLTFIEQPWATTEYSEYYVLIFVCLSLYIYKYSVRFSNRNFISSLLIGLAFLVNSGSIIFIIPLLVSEFIYKKKLKNLFSLFIGLLLPSFVFFVFYYLNDLVEEFFAILFYIPKNYSSAEIKILDSLLVFSDKYFSNQFFYFAIFILFLTYVSNIFLNFKTINLKFQNDLFYISLYLVTSLLYFFLAGKGYDHHLIFFIFFLSFTLIWINNKTIYILISILISLSALKVINQNFSKSFYNLYNHNSISTTYPSKVISNFIQEKSYEDLRILALDHTLILFYLNTPNYSYMIHPANHYFSYITDVLIEIERYDINEINKLISTDPEVIICLDSKLQDCIVDESKYELNEFNMENTTYYGSKSFIIYTIRK